MEYGRLPWLYVVDLRTSLVRYAVTAEVTASQSIKLNLFIG